MKEIKKAGRQGFKSYKVRIAMVECLLSCQFHHIARNPKRKLLLDTDVQTGFRYSR